jgi:glycosyltransferase involved in cell wall biosynthesis
VLSDIPTFRELWDGAAIFVDPADDAGFAQAIEALIDDTAERLMAGQAARQRAKRFTPAVMAAGVASIYHDLVTITDKAKVAA